ncbi:MAG: MFS transporter [Ardenticatenaceae bacterium]|nr:MFS transporter [Ardenticatenaceae bacterium]
MSARKLSLKTLDSEARQGLTTAMLLWFLMNGGFFLIIPLLSVHFVDQLGWAAAFLGLVLAVRQFMQQGLTIFGGALADRFGAKGLIVLGIFIRVVSFVLMGFATTKPMLMLGGVLAAIGGAAFEAPLKAVVAALSPEAMLSDLYARIGVLQNVARTVGPLIGALLIQFEFQVVGLAASGFFAIALLVSIIWLPNIDVSTDKQPVAQGLKQVVQDRAFVSYTALMMGFWFMWAQLSIALPLEAKALTGQDSSVGYMFTVNAIIAVVLQVPALRLAQRYLWPLPIVIVGTLAVAFGLGAVALVHNIGQLYLAVSFFALGTVLVMPTAQTVAATMASPRARGAYFGFNSLALAVGGGIGQLTGGTLVDMAVVLNFPGLPWVVSAMVGTVTAVGLWQFYRRNRVAVTPAALLAAAGD